MKYTTGLKKKADFTRTYQSGRSRADKRLVLYVWAIPSSAIV